MPGEADVWRALLRAKGLTVSELATRLGTTRQHTHRLLSGRRNADARRDELREGFAERFAFVRQRTIPTACARSMRSATGYTDARFRPR